MAHGGMEAKMGAKKMEMKKQTPVVMAVSPVFPPSLIPAPDSMKAVTGGVPKRAPMEMRNRVDHVANFHTLVTAGGGLGSSPRA